MPNQELASQLANRITARIFLYCLLNALLLLPIVIYISLDGDFITTAMQFAFLVLVCSIPMAFLNNIMTRHFVKRTPDNIAITMNPEALRSPLFLSNYVGLPAFYIVIGIIMSQIVAMGLMWWFLMSSGAWLFSGFIAVSAVDKELRWLSIYGTSRKQKVQDSDDHRLTRSANEQHKSSHHSGNNTDTSEDTTHK